MCDHVADIHLKPFKPFESSKCVLKFNSSSMWSACCYPFLVDVIYSWSKLLAFSKLSAWGFKFKFIPGAVDLLILVLVWRKTRRIIHEYCFYLFSGCEFAIGSCRSGWNEYGIRYPRLATLDHRRQCYFIDNTVGLFKSLYWNTTKVPLIGLVNAHHPP